MTTRELIATGTVRQGKVEITPTIRHQEIRNQLSHLTSDDRQLAKSTLRAMAWRKRIQGHELVECPLCEQEVVMEEYSYGWHCPECGSKVLCEGHPYRFHPIFTGMEVDEIEELADEIEE